MAKIGILQLKKNPNRAELKSSEIAHLPMSPEPFYLFPFIAFKFHQ